MKFLPELLTEAVRQAGRELYKTELTDNQIQLQKTRREFEGDMTLVVFPLVKLAGKNPEATGDELGRYIVAYFARNHHSTITGYNVIKGFLNLVVADHYWLSYFGHILGENQFGLADSDSKPRVLVEFASPNTNKPLHLGHLRNIFLGDSVSEILHATGHKVTRVQIINDRGIHICKSMLAWKKRGNGETPESSGLKGDKLVGKYYVEFDKMYKAEQKVLTDSGMSAEEAEKQAPSMLEAQEMLRRWESGDEEVVSLWKKMNGWVYEGFDASYASMGVNFDKLYYESDTYLLGREEVIKGLEQGIFFKKEDGSIWVDLSDEGLDQKALLRRDGTAMYITQDIGTAILRFRDFPDTSYQIYTVGNEQEYHFKVLFKILKRLGFEQADRCYHLSYGMVELPEGKMKSREGTVVDADDLIAEMRDVARDVAAEQGKLDGLSDEEKERLYHIIGLAALKYFLLRVDPVKNMLFNPKESIDFNGHTGPFIQYGYVRTRAILRKSLENTALSGGIEINDQDGKDLGHFTHEGIVLHDAEKAIIQRLHDFGDVIDESARTYNPSLLANYCYELTKDFNAFYQHHSILKEEHAAQRDFRIRLSVKTGLVLRTGMNLLGIEMPERM